MKPLTSSALAAAGYDAAEKQLRVQFKGGNVHTFYDVPQGTYDALVGAKSAGKYFATAIRSKFSTKPPKRNAR